MQQTDFKNIGRYFYSGVTSDEFGRLDEFVRNTNRFIAQFWQYMKESGYAQ